MPPSTSKSNQQRPKKLKLVLNRKQQQKRNWLDLPCDITANILQRIGVHDILENAQKVCTSWRKICKDPAMWRVINMVSTFDDTNERLLMRKMCKHVVDRSQGQLVDITICDFANEELLGYIANRSGQLRRLELACCYGKVFENWAQFLKKFPLLEELSLYLTNISFELIESAGRCCPMLTTLKLNYEPNVLPGNGIGIAIGASLPQLKHLEVIGHFMSDTGLQAILDGCRHLELLDLRHCYHINLEGEFGKKCKEKIKCLKLPEESIEGCPYICGDDP